MCSDFSLSLEESPGQGARVPLPSDAHDPLHTVESYLVLGGAACVLVVPSPLGGWAARGLLLFHRGQPQGPVMLAREQG